MKKLWKPALILAAIAIMAIGMLGSGAWFSDSATSTATTISSGTLSIDDAKLNTLTIANLTNMAPGDVTTTAEIVIENNGNLNLAWFGNLIVSDSDLKNVIYIEDAQMEFLSPTNANWQSVPYPAPWGFGTDHFIKEGKGFGPYPTTWTGPDNLATLTVFDGNSGMAPGTPYEFMGALKPGYKYKLSLRFGFYEGAGNFYQAQGPMTISLNVDATQINVKAMEALYPSLGNMFGWMNNQILDQVEP